MATGVTKEIVYAPADGVILSIDKDGELWVVIFRSDDGVTRVRYSQLFEVYVTGCTRVRAGDAIGAKKLIDFDLSHVHWIGDKDGGRKFRFGVDETVRIEGRGGITVDFDAETKTIAFSSLKITKPKKIVWTVGMPDAPTNGTIEFFLRDCNGVIVKDAEVHFYRERFYQYDIKQRDFSYSPGTGKVKLTVALKNGETCAFHCWPLDEWEKCYSSDADTCYLMIDENDALMIDNTGILLIDCDA